MTPSTIDVATIDVGATGKATVTVKNDGIGPSGTLVVTPIGSGIAATGCAGAPLAAKGTCTIAVTVTPTVAGPISGSIEVGDSFATKKIAVTGTALAPGQFSLAPTSLDLGSVAAGKTATGTVTMENKAPTGLTGIVIAATGTGYTLGTTGTCADALPIGGTCTIVVNFTAPTTSGVAKGTLTVSQGGVTRSVAVSATVQAPAKLALTPGQASLQTVVGTPSSPVTFQVTNTGDVAAVPTVAITGANKDDFSFTSTCATALAGNSAASCTVTVVYNPAKAPATNSAATLTVTEAGGSSASAVLTGTAVLPSTLAITGTATDFGKVVVGGTSAALTFTVTNNGGVNSGALKISSTAGQFATSADCDDKDLPAKGTCTFTATFKPAASDATVVQGSLKAVGADVANPALFGVTGTAVAAAKLAVKPNSLEFGSLPTYLESAPQTLTFSNAGAAPTGALKVENTGAQFKVTGDTCTGAVLDPAGAVKTCTVTVTFTSTGTDVEATGSIVVSDTTGVAGSVSASLHGTGMKHAGLSMSPGVVCPQYQADDKVCYKLASDNPSKFKNMLVGQKTTEKTIIVTNYTAPTDAPDSGVITLAITGDAKDDFAIVQNNCTTLPSLATAAAGSVPTGAATCVATVVFTPSALGLRKATLTLTTTRGGATQTVLEGKGLPPFEIQPLAVSNTSNGLTFDPESLGVHGNVLPYRVWLRSTTAADKTSTVTVTLPATTPADFIWASYDDTIADPDTLLTPNVPADVISSVVGGANPCHGKTVSLAIATGATGPDSNNGFYAADDFLYCDFAVQFYPNSARGTLTADVNAAATNSGTGKLTLTGVANGPLTIGPSPIVVADPVAVGNTLTTGLTLTVTNNGDATQKGLTFALAGTGSGDFQIEGTTCFSTTGATPHPSAVGQLAKNESCKVWLGFKPSTEAAYSVTLTVTAANGAAATDDESATATIRTTSLKTFALLTVTPASVTFPDTAYKKTNADPVVLTINNAGTLESGIATVTVGSDFEILTETPLPAGACNLTGTWKVPAGGCTIKVRAKPASAPTGITKKLIQGTLTVSAPTSGGTVNVPLSYYETSNIMIAPGSGGNVGPLTALLPFTFAPAAYNALVDQPFTVTNLSSSAVSLTFDATTATPFQVHQNTGDCTFGSNTLPAGGSCTLTIRNPNTVAGIIAPDAPQTLSLSDGTFSNATTGNVAQLLLSSTTLAASQLALLSVNGTPAGYPTLSTSTPIDLGTVPVAGSGTTFVGGTAQVWFKNVGGTATQNLTMNWQIGSETGGATDAEFIVDSDETSCVNKALAPNATCSIRVHFTPSIATRSAVRIAKLTMTDTAAVSVYFKATSTDFRSLRVEDSSGKAGFYQFTTATAVGGVSETRTFTLTNNSTGALDLPTAAPSVSGVFSVNETTPNNACAFTSPATSLPVGGTCAFNVTYKPTGSSHTTVYEYQTISLPGGAALGLMFRNQQAAKLEVWQDPTALQWSTGVTSTPLGVDFGTLAVGGTKTQALTVVNTGDVAMAAGLTADTAAGVAGASFSVNNGCEGKVLTAYGTTADRCIVTVTATGASAATASTATFRVGTGTSTTAPAATYGLRAKVLLAPSLTISRVTSGTGGVFATTAVTGTTDVTFRITNGSGTAPSGVVAPSLTGTNADQFAIVGNGCTFSLLATRYCDVVVRFAPKALSGGDAFTAALNAVGAAGGSATQAIQGIAKAAMTVAGAAGSPLKVTIAPSTSASQQLTVWNDQGGNAATTALLTTSLTNPAEFVVTDDQCYGKQLAGNSSCTITVKYIGAATSTEKTASLTVDGGGLQKVTVVVGYTGAAATTH